MFTNYFFFFFFIVIYLFIYSKTPYCMSPLLHHCILDPLRSVGSFTTETTEKNSRLLVGHPQQQQAVCVCVCTDLDLGSAAAGWGECLLLEVAAL